MIEWATGYCSGLILFLAVLVFVGAISFTLGVLIPELLWRIFK